MPGGLHGAHHVQLPGVHIPVAIAEALERNRDLHFVAAVGDAPLGAPHVVGREIRGFACPGGGAREAAARCRTGFGEHAVALDPEGIDGEHQRLPTVVVGAEEQLDVVVLRDAVAVGQCCAHAARGRMGSHAHVQCRAAVPHQHLRAVLRGNPIGGKELGESGEDGRGAPFRFVEHAVDHRGPLGAWHGHLGLAAAAIVYRARFNAPSRRGRSADRGQQQGHHEQGQQGHDALGWGKGALAVHTRRVGDSLRHAGAAVSVVWDHGRDSPGSFSGHSFEIAPEMGAVLFAGVGMWAGRTLARTAPAMPA